MALSVRRALAVLSICIFSVSCSVPEEKPDADVYTEIEGEISGENDSKQIDSLWVLDTAYIHFLKKAFENDSNYVQVIGDKDQPYIESDNGDWETNIDFLVYVGIINADEQPFYVNAESDIEKISEENTPERGEIMQAVKDSFDSGDVPWCDDEGDGFRLVQNYFHQNDGMHESKNRYKQSMDEYFSTC